MSTYTLGLDFGTSSIKGAVIDENKNLICKASVPVNYGNSTLPDGATYISLDCVALYSSTCTIIKALKSKMPEGAEISAIAFACASGNTLLCGEDGEPLINAYSWLNPNMDEESDKVLTSIDLDSIHNISGWPYAKNFPLAHLSHMRVHIPELLDKASHVCMSGDYVNFKLTGEWTLDRSTATPFFLANQQESKWHTPYLEALQIKESQLSKLCNTGDLIGNITESASKETGLKVGTPVYAGSFDHPCAARGSDVLKQGQLLISCGTSWVCFFPSEKREPLFSRSGVLVDPFQSSIGGCWGGIISLPQVAIHVDKLVTKYISDAPDRHIAYDRAAEAAKPGADGLKINPLTDSDKDFSAYSKENIARATMEGTAYALKDLLETLKASGYVFTSAVMAGGPSNSNIWRTITAEIFNIPVEVKYGAYSGAVGAAVVAKDKRQFTAF